MTARLIIIALASAFIVARPALHAQMATAREPVDPRLITVVQNLPERPVLRVSSLHGYTEGTLSVATRANLTLRRGEESRTVPVATIDSVWMRQRSAARGAGAGFAIGALTAGAFAFTAIGMCEGECEGAIPLAVLFSLGVGGGAGALIGGLAGSTVHHWERRYP